MKLSVGLVAGWVNGEVVGDDTLELAAARPLSEAGPGDLTFIDSEKHLAAWHRSPAAAAVVPLKTAPNGKPLIRVGDPLLSFVEIIQRIRGVRPSEPPRIDPKALIHPTAQIGTGCDIGPFVLIGEGTTIGANCRLQAGVSIGRDCILGENVELHPRVTVYDNCRIGNRVTVLANAVIGADGFGYRTSQGRHVKVPQLGWVEIGDDVDIGACTTIDRGTFGPTRIGSGTKIDNLVMIAHNCQIGRNNLIVGQVGLAGSCTTGDYVVLAGQVGIGDHVNIGERTMVGARSGIAHDVPPNLQVLGAPPRPMKEAMRIVLSMDRLPDLVRDMKKVKKHLGLEDSP